MFICQICNEFSSSSVYRLYTDTIYQARKLSIQKLKSDTVHHIVIKTNHGVEVERLYRIVPILKKGLLSLII